MDTRRLGATGMDTHDCNLLPDPDLTIPVRSNRLILDTWQQVFHLECDIKAREREIVVAILGD